MPWVRGLAPYVPGKPEEVLLAERGIEDGAKLASNENPFGPPPKAVEAIRREAARAHRYPDGDARALRQALATRLGVPPEGLVFGNGSNEVLELVIRSFAGPDDEVVVSQRAFVVYRLAATAAGARVVAVPEADDGLAHDLAAMTEAITPRTKVVCIANPNNPTGSWHAPEALAGFLAGVPEHVVVLLDEAYWEYAALAHPEAARTPLAHPGLVRVRTFSKAWGLAGVRLGYAWADPGIAAVVNRVREPFNVNRLAQAAALAALEDEAWVMARVQEVLAERARLEEALAARGLLGARSEGNFVLLRLGSDARARAWTEALEARGVIPRPLAPYGMGEWLRITVGTPGENARLLTAVDEILAGEEA